MSIIFQPTYLYIKKHTITGKCYFGKTTSKDPVKYLGSGKHWFPHIKKYGEKYTETLWYCLFTEKEELIKFAKNCSDLWNIVKSNEWLNLKPETGIDGAGRYGPRSIEERKKISDSKKGSICSREDVEKRANSLRGFKHTQETKIQRSIALRGRTCTPEAIKNSANARRGTKRTQETRDRMRAAQLFIPKMTCPHCEKIGSVSNMKRWHFDNCKVIKI